MRISDWSSDVCSSDLGEVEIDVEELGPELHHAHVAVEVADVEAPQDRPLDLGPALATHPVEVGVLPDVDVGTREAAVAVERSEGRRVGKGWVSTCRYRGSPDA